MEDKFKSKEQLLNEVTILRQRVDEQEEFQSQFMQVEEKYKNIFENAVVGIFQTTTKGRFISANLAAAHIFGYESPEELISTVKDLSSQVYVNPEDRDKVIQLLERYGVAKNIEIQCRKKDGSIMWGLQNSRLIRDKEGNILYIEGTFQDITGRKTAEEGLKESERLFRDLTEKSLVGIYLIQDGVFRYVNSKFAELLAYKADELIETINHEETLFPEDRAAVVEKLRKRESGELSSIHHEFRVVTKKGEVRNVEVYGSRTTYRGRPAVIGTMLDITERARSEELLKQAEEMYRSIFENAVEGFFQTSASNELITANESLAKIYGYNTAEEFVADLRGWKTNFFVNQEEYREFIRGIEEGEYPRGLEIEQYRKDGKRIWVSFNLTPIKGADGSVLRHVGSFVDITERKESEERLRRSEAGLRALIGSMKDVIALVDKQGRYITIDRENPDMLGTSLAGPFEKHLSEAIPEEEVPRFLAAVRKALKTRRTIHIEYCINTKKGERWFLAAISPMTAESAVSIARDITDLKMAEAELRAKSMSLEETNNALKVLLRNMEEAKKELEENVVSNIRVLVMPHVRRLARHKSVSTERVHVEAIETGLKDVASPFLRDLSQFRLTPTEIQVANYVRDGRTTKEIIELMHSTKDSIDMHRYHIRKKLGMNNTKTNLRSYLLSLR
jgi:PAS domain S-box-containing protein